ncbi:hypothetical protein GOBAR_DD13680 [Gossypium barbadense]|nr:hypothetical protein GOBAR_DD13680 [Gossypium barbadense]
MAKDRSISGLEAVHKIQLHFLDGIRDEKQLISSGSLISQSGYEDFVTERSISNICSYPLCRNPLPSEPRRRGRYRSSLKEHRVYDLQETNRVWRRTLIYRFSNLRIKENEEIKAGGTFDSSSSEQGNSKGDSFVNNKIDFTSVVIMNNEYTISESLGSLRQSQRAKPSSMKNVINEMDFTSEIIMNDEYTVSKTPPVSVQGCSGTKLKEAEGQGICKDFEEKCLISGSSSALREKDSSIVELPSSKYVYQSGLDTVSAEAESARAKKLNCSVTWADNKNVDNARKGSLCEVKETNTQKGDSEICGRTDNGDDDNMLRFASAKVCAMALRKAAAAVASGDSDVNDAVSEAGLIILPHALEADKEEQVKNVDTFEPEAEPEQEEGPVKDEIFHEEYLSVNGREYPQKIVLRNGRSSEIKETLAGCISSCFNCYCYCSQTAYTNIYFGARNGAPTRNNVFRVSTSSIQNETVAICRVPSLTPLMTNGRMLLQRLISIFSQFFCICIRHDSLEVLDGAQISMEEYEVMKDLIIPFGRAPHFSEQSRA